MQSFLIATNDILSDEVWVPCRALTSFGEIMKNIAARYPNLINYNIELIDSSGRTITETDEISLIEAYKVVFTAVSFIPNCVQDEETQSQNSSAESVNKMVRDGYMSNLVRNDNDAEAKEWCNCC